MLLGFIEQIFTLVRLRGGTFNHVLIFVEFSLVLPGFMEQQPVFLFLDLLDPVGLYCALGYLTIPTAMDLLSALSVQDYANSCLIWAWDPTVLHMPLPSGLNVTVLPANFYRFTGYNEFQSAIEELLTYDMLTSHDCSDILQDMVLASDSDSESE